LAATFNPQVLIKGECRPSFMTLDHHLARRREACERPVDVDGVNARRNCALVPYCI
jgi:hypothetical protein